VLLLQDLPFGGAHRARHQLDHRVVGDESDPLFVIPACPHYQRGLLRRHDKRESSLVIRTRARSDRTRELERCEPRTPIRRLPDHAQLQNDLSVRHCGTAQRIEDLSGHARAVAEGASTERKRSQ
jgi:hypothetical protein